MSLGKPQASANTPPETSRTHSPAWQPLPAQEGIQKWARPHSRQYAARQVEHQPNGSVSAAPQSRHIRAAASTLRLLESLTSLLSFIQWPLSRLLHQHG